MLGLHYGSGCPAPHPPKRNARQPVHYFSWEENTTISFALHSALQETLSLLFKCVEIVQNKGCIDMLQIIILIFFSSNQTYVYIHSTLLQVAIILNTRILEVEGIV